MQKFRLIIIAIAFLAFAMSSCLTVEKKQYTFEFTGNNSGKLTIKYINIMGSEDDSTKTTEEDFYELIDDYYNGDKIEKNYPYATNIQKRLFEENGQLCGEVTMNFNNLSAARLYQYDKKSPIMFSISQALDSEEYLESNGTYGGEFMKVVFWPKGTKKLTITTKVSSPDSYTSLLADYKKWRKNK
ncbi:MAG TPA: hypothetical protein P5250_06895 [Bacteroidales bacterium]|nr:hypothetical protein [Bacteroidales bacterium]